MAKEFADIRGRRAAELCTVEGWNRVDARNMIASTTRASGAADCSNDDSLLPQEVVASLVSRFMKQTADEGVEIPSLTVALKDSLTMRPIQSAARCATCTHIQPFDLDTFLESCERAIIRHGEKEGGQAAVALKCYVCMEGIRLDDICQDTVMTTLFRIAEKTGDRLEVFADGHYVVHGRLMDHEDDDDSDEDDDGPVRAPPRAPPEQATATHVAPEVVNMEDDIEEEDKMGNAPVVINAPQPSHVPPPPPPPSKATLPLPSLPPPPSHPMPQGLGGVITDEGCGRKRPRK